MGTFTSAPVSERSRLGAALNSIALEARVGLGDFELDEHLRLAANQFAVSILQRNGVVFLKPLSGSPT